jgi:hypothetical protein
MNVEQEINDAFAFLNSQPDVMQFTLIGSAAFMPDKAKDVDLAVRVKLKTTPKEFCATLGSEWLPCGKEDYPEGPGWTSVRRGNVNLMVTNDGTWFRNYVQAMHVCAYLKLEDKVDRIAVCKIVRDELDAKTATDWATWFRIRPEVMHKDDEL